MTGRKKPAPKAVPARRSDARSSAKLVEREATAPKAKGADDMVAKAVHDVMHPAPPVGLAASSTGPKRKRSKTPLSAALAASAVPPRELLEPTAPLPPPVAASPPTAPQLATDVPPPSIVTAEPPPPEPVAPPPAAAGAEPETAASPAPSRSQTPEPPRRSTSSGDAIALSVTAPMPDLEALSRNMTQLVEESRRIAATLSEVDRPQAFQTDVTDAVQTLGQVAEHWFGDPARLIQAQTSLTAGFFDLWAKSAGRFATTLAPEPAAKAAPVVDKRFKDPEWQTNPVFDVLHKAFLLGSRWANSLVDDADGIDEPTREKARFYMRQITSALSPSNFVPTNPELLRETLKENGGNLLRGMKMLAEDLAAGNGQLKIRQTDTSKFALGVNMAMTPGKVVFRNDLMELLQYSPSTPEVVRRPLLIVPPWINKFYVLDLNPEKSFIRWAVSQGLTVFVISWVNPDERHATKGFEAYMREGILAALDEVTAITGSPDATAIGYCVGGTLLAVTLAFMAAHGDTRLSSATLFTAQIDFTHAGDLKIFADESQIRSLETQMKQQGYLMGAQMAQAFNMLRPEDLIWSYWVNNYLRGKEPPAFDLLAWNSDSTRMPASNHSFYLRNCYLENNLSRGLMEIGGERLDTRRITIPIYNLATREDHIAPARSVFEGCRSLSGPVRYVLSGSGHVAGVVNPPNKVKYGYTAGPPPVGSLEEWLQKATEYPGSWWPDWVAWIKAQAPDTVPAREPGGGRPTLGDAPGDYVKVKA